MGDFFSGKNIAVKIILVVITIVVLLAVSFFTIMDGIVNLVFSFFKDMGDIIINVAEKYLEEMILQKPFGGDLKFYKIDETAVNSLKSDLENSGIDTETCGLTQIRLRKILLAQAVSTSFDQTLCMATVTEQEILENVKQKDEYKNIGSLQDFLNKPVKTEESKNLWPDVENLTNYTLYYDSDKFFYFQDTDNRFENGANQWYLGAMGVITLTRENGTNMVYGNEASFNQQKAKFEAAKKTWTDRDDDFSEEEVVNIYTDGDSPNEIRVWNIITKQKMYDYTFKNEENGKTIEQKGKDEEKTYEIKEQVINIQDKLDISSFAISIELMIDLLDMTSSGEFLETFIDYALRDLDVSAKVYKTEEVQITYSKEKFNISNGFIIEVYDFIDVGDGNVTDLGDDNFRAYADIVYKRTYQGRPFESVAKLLNQGKIDYNGEFKEEVTINDETVKEYFGELGEDVWNLVEKVLNFVGEASEKIGLTSTIKAEIQKYIDEHQETLDYLSSLLGLASDKVKGVLGDLIDAVFDGEGFSYNTYYQVGPLSQYLKTAYDPGTGFVLGNIEVEEKTRTRKYETSCDMAPSKVKTWYGEIEYSDPNIVNNYLLSVNGGEEIEITETEYNSFGYSKLEEDTTATTSQQKERIYTSQSIVEQYNSLGSDSKVEIYSYLSGGTDLTDEVFKRKPGKNNTDHYDAWTSNGLFEIAVIDEGTYNTDIGAGTGSDYIYLKYKKDNIKKYKDATKIKRNILDTTNVTKTVSNNDMEAKLKEFLGLLKNVDGTIPTGGTTKEFKKVKDGGKVVLYGDIYKGHIPAGDLLLDNGALMLFELLESNENTQGLVNIFKYLAHLYSESETDYGITDISQIGYLLSVGSYSGSNFIVNTGMSSKDIVLTKEQLEDIIEKTYSGQAKANLLSCVDDFIYIQETYKVNAVFAVAVTIIESSGGTNWAAIDSSTYNWMSVTGSYNGNSYKNPNSGNSRTWRVYPSFNEATRDFGDLIANGSYYFKAGKYSVKDIAPTYCNEGWGNKIISEMTKMYNKIGISLNTGGIEGVSGNVTTFTVGSRTYKNYKQIEDAYKSIPLANFPGSNLRDSGCAVTSVAIIATGFGQNVDPIAVNNYESQVGTTAHEQVVSHYTGMKCTWVYSDIKNGVINQLKKGYPVMVHVGPNSGTFSTGYGHFFVILSISEDGNSIYVSDPASRKDGIRTGWLKTSVLNESAFDRYMKMEEK